MRGRTCLIIAHRLSTVQHADKILAMTDNAIVLERGRIAHQAASAALLADPPTLHRYLAVGG